MATLTLKRKKVNPSVDVTIIKECIADLINGLNQYIEFLEKQNIEIESCFIKILRDDICSTRDEIEQVKDINQSQLKSLERIHSLLDTQTKNYSINERNMVELNAFKNCIKDFAKLINLFSNILNNRK